MVPTKDVDINANCAVGTADVMFIPEINTSNGTKITPPPIPNRLEIMPAANVPE
jgi:hypothetical protein